MSRSSQSKISSLNIHGIDACTLERDTIKEVFATAIPQPGEEIRSLIKRVRGLLGDTNAEVVRMHVFGGVDHFDEFADATMAELGDISWPLTFVEGDSCTQTSLAGIQLHAVSDALVDTIRLGGAPVGRVFADSHARYCYLGDLRASDTNRSRAEQGRESFLLLENGLEAAGMSMDELVRTWLFIDDILDWYDDFNKMRDVFFNERGMFDRFLPASTGIGGANPYGAAVALCAVALQPLDDSAVVQEVLSPMQCPAHDYGSSFSRAAGIDTPDYRCVLVSGTASIAPEGETVHVGDTQAQVDLTMRVVREILKSRGLDFKDTTRANAYFKHQNDASGFGDHCEKYGLPPTRVVVSEDAVCRDDLLFEIELDAFSEVR